MDGTGLRRLLDRAGSYPVIRAAAASGQLNDMLPVKLFEHIGAVYQRLETAADPDSDGLAALRLAVLVHEEPPESLRRPLAGAGLSDLEETVGSVTGGFGAIWKVKPDREIADYVARHSAHLAALLLFELAHEGGATPEMERAAEFAGLGASFRRWGARLLARGTVQQPWRDVHPVGSEA